MVYPLTALVSVRDAARRRAEIRDSVENESGHVLVVSDERAAIVMYVRPDATRHAFHLNGFGPIRVRGLSSSTPVSLISRIVQHLGLLSVRDIRYCTLHMCL